MNPYNFVRVNWADGVPRRPATFHQRFEGFSGRLEGTITTLTPLFIPDSESNRRRRRIRDPFNMFITNNQGQHIIPGSSLKGLIRSLVETIGPGCWWLYKGEYDDGNNGKVRYPLPNPDFDQCHDIDRLCFACRMFGLINDSTLLEGHVRFEDAICEEPTLYDPIYTIILGGPKPRHRAFYLDEQGKLVGRKFYYHHSIPPTDRKKLDLTSKGIPQNQYIQPLDSGNVFRFSVHFDNLAQEELNLLLYALELESTMRHKLGQGKPAGLGSVEINLTRLELIDYSQRYTSPNRGMTQYEGDTRRQYVSNHTADYARRNTVTMQDLRDIWRWPGRDDLCYPDYDWFKNNSAKRLNETPGC